MEQEHLVASRNDSPWRDYTSSAQEEQAGFCVQAEYPLAGLTVPELLTHDCWQGQPMLAIDTARRCVVVNAEIFGDLIRPDATALAPGESARIGALRRPEAFPGYRAVADFLLRAQIVRTYVHLGADIRRVAERETETEYLARYLATHEYCTNTCHRVDFGFSIAIDKSTGDIRVTGEEAHADNPHRMSDDTHGAPVKT